MFIFLCRNSSLTKSTSSSFFLWVTTNHDCTTKRYDFYSKYRKSFSDCLNLSIWMGKYYQGRGNTLCWEKIQSLAILPSTLKFLFCSPTCNLQIFVWYLPICSEQRFIKTEVLQVPQKVRIVLVPHFSILSKIRDYHFPGWV